MDKGECIMVKVVLILVLSISLKASVYSTNCLPCHQKLPIGIDKFFYRYLLKYSSEIETKYAMSQYLKNQQRG